jgi:nicotinamidase-related amidase
MPEAFGNDARDYHIVKPRYSAFFSTELDLILRRLGVRHVILTGTTTPNCIRASCYDAISLDYAVTVLSDCTSSKTAEIQKSNLRDMANIGAEITDSDTFLRNLTM